MNCIYCHVPLEKASGHNHVSKCDICNGMYVIYANNIDTIYYHSSFCFIYIDPVIEEIDVRYNGHQVLILPLQWMFLPDIAKLFNRAKNLLPYL